MKKSIISLILLLTAYCSVLSQEKIKGYISDYDNQPVAFATVYINATTIGTITNETGNFELSVPYYPCEIVVSHLNYKTEHLYLESHNVSNLKIKVSKKIFKIKPITVVEKNQRNENLRLFKLNFLGKNYLKNKVIIENEDQIKFNREYRESNQEYGTKRIMVKKDDPNWINSINNITEPIGNKIPAKLNAWSDVPLIVSVPELGYIIHIDLVDFYYVYRNEQGFNECYYSGYFYFQEKKTTKRIQKNRNDAYFNSTQHFCRSLYNNELKLNGYKVLRESKDSLLKGIYEAVDLTKYAKLNENFAQITGLKGETFYILYNGKLNNSPIDLNIKKPIKDPTQSQIYFASDSCTMTSNGIIPNNLIIFSPTIGAKKVASMVPDNFIPYDL